MRSILSVIQVDGFLNLLLTAGTKPQLLQEADLKPMGIGESGRRLPNHITGNPEELAKHVPVFHRRPLPRFPAGYRIDRHLHLPGQIGLGHAMLHPQQPNPVSSFTVFRCTYKIHVNVSRPLVRVMVLSVIFGAVNRARKAYYHFVYSLSTLNFTIKTKILKNFRFAQKQ